MRAMRWARLVAGTAVLAVVIAGCGTEADPNSGGDDGAEKPSGFTPPDIPMAESIGEGEGSVSILAWPGYVEDGSTDKKVDWVTPFEKETGCEVTVKTFGTSDEAVELMKQGGYDVVSASGDASLRLIAAGEVAPVNTDLFKNYADVWPFLKEQKWNSVNGQMYGMPHGYGANVLMWRKDKVKPAPTSWDVVFEPGSKYSGKITAYDSPIYIADAAMYLKYHKPELGIEDPYALDEDQLAAAVELLKQQKEMVGEYWSDFNKEIAAFQAGDIVVGTTWQIIANFTDSKKSPVEVTVPQEGVTGWSDTWMISSKTESPNCSYLWMDHIASPEANAGVAEWFGEAPANAKACELTSKGHCETFHAGDAEYASKIYYWNTPIEECLDGRTDVKCTSYDDWVQAWTEVKG